MAKILPIWRISLSNQSINDFKSNCFYDEFHIYRTSYDIQELIIYLLIVFWSCANIFTSKTAINRFRFSFLFLCIIYYYNSDYIIQYN